MSLQQTQPPPQPDEQPKETQPNDNCGGCKEEDPNAALGKKQEEEGDKDKKS